VASKLGGEGEEEGGRCQRLVFGNGMRRIHETSKDNYPVDVYVL